MHNFNSDLIDDLRAHDGHATSGPFVGRQVLILTTTRRKDRRAGARARSPTRSTATGSSSSRPRAALRPIRPGTTTSWRTRT